MTITVIHGQDSDLLQKIYRELNEVTKLGISDKVVLRIIVKTKIEEGAKEQEVYEACYVMMGLARHNGTYKPRTQEEFARALFEKERNLEEIIRLAKIHTGRYTTGATVHRADQTLSIVCLSTDLLEQRGANTIQEAKAKDPEHTASLIKGLYELEQITGHYI